MTTKSDYLNNSKYAYLDYLAQAQMANQAMNQMSNQMMNPAIRPRTYTSGNYDYFKQQVYKQVNHVNAGFRQIIREISDTYSQPREVLALMKVTNEEEQVFAIMSGYEQSLSEPDIYVKYAEKK